MRIETLYEFVFLATNLNFTDTARSFYISQSVLSNHISNLEKELGVKLFTRNNRSVRLTRVGAVFLDDARHILSTYEDAQTNIELAQQGTDSLIRVGLLLGSFGPFLPTACHRFLELHPEYDFVLRVLDISEVLAALNSDWIDIGFTVFAQELQGSEWDYRTFFEDRYKLAVPKTHPLANKTSIQLADLRGETLVAPRFNPLRGTLAQMNVMVRNAGIGVQVNQSIEDAASLVATLVATNRIAIAIDHLEVYGHDDLVFIPVEDERTRVCAGPMWKRSCEKRGVGEFIDFLDEETAGFTRDDFFRARP